MSQLDGWAGEALDGKDAVKILFTKASHFHYTGTITLELDYSLNFAQEAGMFANMPVGTPHSLKNESNRPAKMLISVAPAGLEQMFFEVGVPVAQGVTTDAPPTKEEIEKLKAVAPRFGIEIRLPGH